MKKVNRTSTVIVVLILAILTIYFFLIKLPNLPTNCQCKKIGSADENESKTHSETSANDFTRSQKKPYLVESYKESVKKFHKIALTHKSDKVTAQSYQFVYGLYLTPLRYNKISLLEIGLGCGMKHGPGKSLKLWKEFFSNVTIDIIEKNKLCAESYRSQVNKLFLGDQSDFEFLESIGPNNSYDVIVDDGGHSRKQQIHSLIGLWECLKPGGVYVIEDIYLAEEGHKTVYNDYDVSTVEVILHLIALFNKQVAFRRKDLDVVLREIFNKLLSVNCFAHACVLVKKY
jgi:hypothetical protein